MEISANLSVLEQGFCFKAVYHYKPSMKEVIQLINAVFGTTSRLTL